MTKSKKITILLCSILFAFVGFFGFILANKNDTVVKADTTVTSYSYTGSTFNVRFSRFSSRSTSSISTSVYDDGLWRYRYVNGSHYLDFLYTSSTYSFNINVNPGSFYDNWVQFNSLVFSSNRYFVIPTYLSSNSFNGNIVRIVINADLSGSTLGSENGTHVRFYDNLDNFIWFQLPIWHGFNSNVYKVINNTTYFLSTSFNDNQYFMAGYDNGYDAGLVTGSNEGYSNGYDAGFSDGDSAGFNRGVASSNDYTFLGLIGATIDAPITALFGRLDTNPNSDTYNQYVGGFFNFTLLGVNLRDFFFAILTFALVIVIVRFALAR